MENPTPTALSCSNCNVLLLYPIISLTCPQKHHTCLHCLCLKMQENRVDCYQCPYKFECLYDEMSHI